MVVELGGGDMKIAVIGFSGAGKSTLAAVLGKHYDIPVLHMDAIHFLPNWVERDDADMLSDVQQFLSEHDSWVIDGNYSRILFDARIEQADRIVILQFNRLVCFWRAFWRSKKYKNQTRPDMAPGCMEKFDKEFARWILFEQKRKVKRYKLLQEQYGNKITMIRNQRQLDKFMKNQG